MIKTNILLAWRSIRKNPYIYLLNITGLSVGISVFLYIVTYTSYEFSYDEFHKDADRIYRINHIMKHEDKDSYVAAATFPKVGPALVEEFDQVEASFRMVESWNGVVAQVDKKQTLEHDQVFFAESGFFELFSIPMIHGDRNTVLDDLHTVALSEEVAMKHFETTDCVGKRITIRSGINGEQEYLIRGVFDSSLPTHLNVNILLSFPSLLQTWGQETDRNWRWFDFITYVRLKDGTNPEILEEQFPAFIDKHGGERLGSNTIDFDLFKASDIHLKSNVNQELTTNGDIVTIRFLLIIGVFIIIIAWINYINLYTAKAVDRSKEVGVRKALGSSKKDLIIQFLIETSLINFISIGLGFAGFLLIGFYVKSVLGLEFQPSVALILSILLWIVPFFVISTLISGLCPSILVAKIATLQALKGMNGTTSGASLRKVLVSFQFMISAFMIGGTLIVISQLSYMNNEPIGVDVSNTLILEVPNYADNRADYVRAIRVLKSKLENTTGVEQVSLSSDLVGKQIGWRGSSILINQPEDRLMIYKMTMDKGHLTFLDARFLAGTNFLNDKDSLSVIINEEAMHLYSFDNPEDAINKRILFAGMDTMKVVGVIQNYYQESLKEAIKPTAYFRINHEIKYLSMRYQRDDTQEFLSAIEQDFIASFPNVPFSYHFMNDLLKTRHRDELVFTYLFNSFSAIAIIISLLGLLGLAYFVANKRKKEVGVRKVLGSSTQNIIFLVFKDFAKLIIIGNMVAIPLLWKFGSSWLNDFSFHINFPWIVPVLTVTFCVLISFILTLSNILKLSRTNPVEVLKDE